MARKGPVTTDTTSIALGLAQVRIGASAANIANIHNTAFTSSDSIGSLGQTKFTGNVDWFRHESGFPLIEDLLTAVREAAAMEITFHEINPANVALAYGHDPTSSPYSTMTVHSGEVPLGARTAPDVIRMEALYTFPSGTDYMAVIFPRAQVSAAVEIDLAPEDAAAVPAMIESKNASSDVSGGNALWDDKPLGRIYFYSD